MAKRGPKMKRKVNIEWSADFAYAIGLLATDGCLGKDGRSIDFSSKDIEQIEHFRYALKIESAIGTKLSGKGGRLCYRTQISDSFFHRFLDGVGVRPAKSKTLGKVDIPDQFFFDFLRGCFDGDGSIHSYWDARWKASFMMYTIFASASREHIVWLQEMIFMNLKIAGHITKSDLQPCYQLKYAKGESLVLLHKMYYSEDILCLSRKQLKIKGILAIVCGPQGKKGNAQVAKLADAPP